MSEFFDKQDWLPVNPEASLFVNPQFRVGDRDLTREFFDDGNRFLIWERSPEGDALSDLAGWKHYNHSFGERVCSLQLPLGTRNGASVLSGMEAWRGEKQDVLEHVVDYVKKSFTKLAAIDGNVSLYTTAITKEGDTFFTPPHRPVRDKSDILDVCSRLEQEVDEILSGSEGAGGMLQDFSKKLNQSVQTKRRR